MFLNGTEVETSVIYPKNPSRERQLYRRHSLKRIRISALLRLISFDIQLTSAAFTDMPVFGHIDCGTSLPGSCRRDSYPYAHKTREAVRSCNPLTNLTT